LSTGCLPTPNVSVLLLEAAGNDADAVVDSRLRINGLQGLRLVAAAIMPTITTGNTNLPAIMIAEKTSDVMIEDLRKTA